MYIHMCVCTCVCIAVSGTHISRIHTHTNIYIHIHTYIHMHTFKYVHIHIHIHTYIPHVCARDVYVYHYHYIIISLYSAVRAEASTSCISLPAGIPASAFSSCPFSLSLAPPLSHTAPRVCTSYHRMSTGELASRHRHGTDSGPTSDVEPAAQHPAPSPQLSVHRSRTLARDQWA